MLSVYCKGEPGISEEDCVLVPVLGTEMAFYSTSMKYKSWPWGGTASDLVTLNAVTIGLLKFFLQLTVFSSHSQTR